MAELRPYNVRRLFLEHEVNAVRRLLIDATEFTSHYPGYSEWLDMCLREVLKGKRAAFGLFLSGFSDNNIPESTLVGSILLKPNHYANTIELKNIYVHSDCRGKGYGRSLINFAFTYCSQLCTSNLESEVPCDLSETIGFFHNVGFRVTAMRRSPYISTQYLYRMEHRFTPAYAGDPFDLLAMSNWTLQNYYSYELTDIQKNVISFGVESPDSEHQLARNLDLRIIGNAVVCVNADDDEHVIRNAESQSSLTIVFCEKIGDRLKASLKDRGIKVIEWKLLLDCLAPSLAHSHPIFSRDQIGGIVLVVNADFTRRILDLKGDSLVFIKTGELGKYILPGQTIVLFSEPTPTCEHGRILAVGECEDMICDHPSTVWKIAKSIGSLFEEHEYVAFSAGRSSVLMYRIKNMLYLDESNAELQNHLLMVVSAKSWSPSNYYIDHGTALHVRQFISSPQACVADTVTRESEYMDEDLRVAYLAANPNGTDYASLGTEMRIIRDVLSTVEQQRNIVMKPYFATTFDELQRCLLEFRPNIVHFAGHGSADGILLEQERGSYLKVALSDLASFLCGVEHGVWLIILNSCYSSAEAGALLTSVPYVVAAANALEDDDALRFSKAFYRGLAYRRSVKECFNLGRSSVEIAGKKSMYQLLCRDNGEGAAKPVQ